MSVSLIVGSVGYGPRKPPIIINVHNVRVSAFCRFFTFSASWGLVSFSTSRDLSLRWTSGVVFRSGSGVTADTTGGFFSVVTGGLYSTSEVCGGAVTNSRDAAAGAGSSVGGAVPFVGVATSSSLTRSSEGREASTVASTVAFSSSRGFVGSKGLSTGVSNGDGVIEVAPCWPFACARAAALANFSCCLFSARACAFAFLSWLFVSGTGSVLRALCQRMTKQNTMDAPSR